MQPKDERTRGTTFIERNALLFCAVTGRVRRELLLFHPRAPKRPSALSLQTALSAGGAVSLVRYERILLFIFAIIYHQLTRTHKVLGAKQHGITVSSSFEIQPVFLHSSSLLCHTLWLLKLKDPKELVLRAIQGRGAQYYWM